MGQQAVFRAERQLSERQAPPCGAEVGCGGGHCVGCVVCAFGGGEWRGGEGLLPTPASPSPSLSLQLPAKKDRCPQREKRWREQVKHGEGGRGERLKGWRRRGKREPLHTSA